MHFLHPRTLFVNFNQPTLFEPLGSIRSPQTTFVSLLNFDNTCISSVAVRFSDVPQSLVQCLAHDWYSITIC